MGVLIQAKCFPLIRRTSELNTLAKHALAAIEHAKSINSYFFYCMLGHCIYMVFITCLVAMDGIDISEEHLPFWLKLSDAVVLFPMNCQVDLSKDPSGLSGHASDEYFIALSVLNSLF